MIIMGTFTSILHFQSSQKQYKHDTLLLIQRLGFNLEWPLWDYNTEWIENVIEIETEHDFVKMIALYNEDDKLVLGLNKDKTQITHEDFQKALSSLKNSKDLFYSKTIFHHELDSTQIEIGKIAVITTKSYLVKQLTRDIFLTIVQFILMDIILIVILHLSLKRIIIHPLQDFCLLIARFKEDNLLVKADFNQNSEMKILSETFNNMAKTIHNYAETMKQKVASRTQELQEYNARLLNVQKQIATEMQIAQKIQETIIPKVKFQELDYVGFYRPKEQLGGDYYDILKLDDGRFAFLLADACGHGIPAAMVTLMAKISFQKNINSFMPVEEVIKNVNDDLCDIIKNKEYIAAFYGELDLNKNILTYSNAFLPEVILLQKSGQVQCLLSNSSVIGYHRPLTPNVATISIEETSKIILYSDGITEFRNNNSIYGLERLKSVIKENSSCDAEALKNAIIKDLNMFMPIESAQDDLTLFILDLEKTSIEIIKNF